MPDQPGGGRSIPFFSLCEHHSLPFSGRAYVGYIAHEHILGQSKLTRLVRLFARRFTVQERIGQQLADALERILPPHGVAVHLEAVHLCTQMRGVREIESSTHHLPAPQLRPGPGAAGRVLPAVRPTRLTGMTGVRSRLTAGGMPPPLSRLYERAGCQPGACRARSPMSTAGMTSSGPPCVYANFVASVDAVTALGPEYPSSGSAISGHDPADRFVMGLLRACADVVLIGAGTLRATPGHLWTPGHACPAADGYAAFRRGLGRDGDPMLAVLTARRDVPGGHPALRAGALVLTTAAGARRVRGRLPPACTILDLGDRPELLSAAVLAAARDRGASRVLTEGGPRLLGQLAAEGLLDELFLTISPVLAGRGDTARPGLVVGLELLPGRTGPAELLSVRRHGSCLFLRYAIRGTLPAATADSPVLGGLEVKFSLQGSCRPPA